MKAQTITLEELIERLKEFAGKDFPVQEVHRFLKDSTLHAEELKPYLFWDRGQYTRNLIYKSEEFELLAICWQPGHEAPAHGHEGEKCWARVESGRLRFTNYVELPSSHSFRLEVTSSTVGEPGYLDGPADIHKVENSFDDPAVTLHIYSKPYAQCDIYDLETQSRTRKQLCYYSKFGRREDE